MKQICMSFNALMPALDFYLCGLYLFNLKSTHKYFRKFCFQWTMRSINILYSRHSQFSSRLITQLAVYTYSFIEQTMYFNDILRINNTYEIVRFLKVNISRYSSFSVLFHVLNLFLFKNVLSYNKNIYFYVKQL